MKKSYKLNKYTNKKGVVLYANVCKNDKTIFYTLDGETFIQTEIENEGEGLFFVHEIGGTCEILFLNDFE